MSDCTGCQNTLGPQFFVGCHRMLVNSGVRYKFHCILFNSNLYLLSLPGLNVTLYRDKFILNTGHLHIFKGNLHNFR